MKQVQDKIDREARLAGVMLMRGEMAVHSGRTFSRTLAPEHVGRTPERGQRPRPAYVYMGKQQTATVAVTLVPGKIEPQQRG
jgi:hypothetical protein